MVPTSLLMSVTSAGIAILYFVVDLVFLVLVLTTVRTKRPDAWAFLAAAVAIALVTNPLAALAAWLGAAFVSGSDGMDAFMRFTLITHLSLGIINVGARVLYIVGVVRLAGEPSPLVLRDGRD